MSICKPLNFSSPTSGKKTTLGRRRTSTFCGNLLWNRSCGIITLETPLFSNSSLWIFTNNPLFTNKFYPGKLFCALHGLISWDKNIPFLGSIHWNSLKVRHEQKIIFLHNTNSNFHNIVSQDTYLKTYKKINTIWEALQIKSRLPFWMTQSISAPKLE